MKVSKTLYRLTARVCSFLVRRLNFSPKRLGYRELISEEPLHYRKRSSIRPNEKPHAPFDYYRGGQDLIKPLPLNIKTQKELRSERQKFGIAFYDIPRRKSEPEYLTTVSNVKIIGFRDHYGNEFYSIITSDDRCLNVKGTGFMPEHGRLLRSRNRPNKIKKAAWFLEHWYDNYFHWLAFHLPKLILIMEYGLNHRIIFPSLPKLNSSAIIRTSCEYIGVNPYGALNACMGVTEVEELTIVNIDLFSDRLIRKVRNKFIAPSISPGDKKIYISRANAKWRQIINDDEIHPILSQYDFKIVEAETFSFKQQIAIMADAGLILGLHGAGLGNMLFCPKGVHVVEIADVEVLPNPHYYAFASALGHKYWLVKGKTIGKKQPAYRDIYVNPMQLKKILDAIG